MARILDASVAGSALMPNQAPVSAPYSVAIFRTRILLPSSIVLLLIFFFFFFG